MRAAFLSQCAVKLIHSLWLSLIFMESCSAKVLEKTLAQWMQYKDECFKKMANDPYPSEMNKEAHIKGPSDVIPQIRWASKCSAFVGQKQHLELCLNCTQPIGIFCNRTFDMYACWPDGSPGAIVNVSCPFYLPWYEKVKHGLVSQKCGLDGHWVLVNGTELWRDHSQCLEEMEATAEEEGVHRLMVSFKVIYTVGYALSLLALVLALLILTVFRKLRCTRNYIHANLFASFGLRALSVIVKDALMERLWRREVFQVSDWETLWSHEVAIGCRVAQVTMQYCILANHYWFLVEAVYLYKLLIGAVFSEKNYYTLYLYLGWGTPVAFVVPWMAAKYLKENTECWGANENMAYWWIIRIPILLASVINLLIFMQILKVIMAKLRANQKHYVDYKLRLAKATLTLVPLFGIHEVVFIFATDEQTTGILRYIKVFFTLFLNSFQGFLVAVLYCFANKEVKSEMKKKWQLWKLDHPALCCTQ